MWRNRGDVAAGGIRRISRIARGWRVPAFLLLALAAAGCAAGPGSTSTAPLRGVTVTFESIDGPPSETFRKLVQTLGEEASSREMVVVPRGGEALYRVRSYLAAHGQGSSTSVSWAWDVYRSDQSRAFRLTGEERAESKGRSAWAVADDRLLRQLARSGMDQLASFILTDRATPEASERSLWSIADDFRPEAAGIFRRISPFEPGQPPSSDIRAYAPER